MAKKKPKKPKKRKKRTNESNTIKKRIAKNQEFWLESYKKRWTVTAACLETGINRATYYEWLKKYPDFKKKVAMDSNRQQDYVETKLVESINDLNIAAIIFWLKHRHPRYKIDQFKFKGEIKSKIEISDEQFNQLIENLRRRKRESPGEEGSEGKAN